MLQNKRLIKVDASMLTILFAVAAVMLIVAPHAAQALPTSGANFNVNSNADTNSQDSVLTLHEALLVANSTLTGPFNDAEKDQMPDCIFSGSTNNWTITGGCLGVPDWIYFVSNYTITLTSALPVLSADGTMISATPGQVVKINANNGVYNVFEITGNDVQINGVRVYGAGTGRSNIYITGSAKRVKISNNYIGDDDGNSPCNDPNAYGGIYINSTGAIGGSDARAWIYGNTILCHGSLSSEGISLVGTDNVVIGADDLGNAGNAEINYIAANENGIVIESGSHDNYVRNANIDNNRNLGVWISGSGTNYNVLKESSIYLNSTGVQIDGGAQYNRIGNQVGAPITTANTIGGNTGDGIYISGASTANNAVYGNKIGTNSAGTAADANGGNGVVLDNGTHDNDIGSTISETNVIAGNGLDGVLINNGSHDNRVAYNGIGRSSTDNIPNHVDGIGIVGSFTNTIGGINQANTIWTNSASGIYLTGGSQHNLIGANNIAFNGAYGVMFDGNNTFYNTISRTWIALNNRDGIGERNNAVANVWSEVSIYQNSGLGIDKNASSDFTNVIDPPYMFFDSINRNTGVVQGHADTTDFVFDITKIELYRVAPDPSGFGEGKYFVGSTYTDGSGNWTITDPSPAQSAGCYTAFVTEAFPFLLVPLHSSEFSVNTCRTFLPLVFKNF